MKRIAANLKLSVEQVRERYPDWTEDDYREHAIRRAKFKQKMKERQRVYNLHTGALERMEKRGCKPCELKRQREYIQKLMREL